MYNSLKRIAKFIIPKSILKKNESLFRRLISIKYSGGNHLCNICSKRLNQFVTIYDEDLLCPNCGSRSRTRRLYDTLKNNNVLHGNVLHFSPNKILYSKFKNLDIEYFSTDFEDEFTADYRYDITAIPKEDNFFDVIICYHVLEHIEDDTKAISELHRVLKPSGSCYIQTPFKDGEIYEDRSIRNPADREKAFGQKDHVRIYSIKGLERRLDKVGFSIEINNYKSNAYFGYKEETVIIAKKIISE